MNIRSGGPDLQFLFLLAVAPGFSLGNAFYRACALQNKSIRRPGLRFYSQLAGTFVIGDQTVLISDSFPGRIVKQLGAVSIRINQEYIIFAHRAVSDAGDAVGDV